MDSASVWRFQLLSKKISQVIYLPICERGSWRCRFPAGDVVLSFGRAFLSRGSSVFARYRSSPHGHIDQQVTDRDHGQWYEVAAGKESDRVEDQAELLQLTEDFSSTRTRLEEIEVMVGERPGPRDAILHGPSLSPTYC